MKKSLEGIQYEDICNKQLWYFQMLNVLSMIYRKVIFFDSIQEAAFLKNFLLECYNYIIYKNSSFRKNKTYDKYPHLLNFKNMLIQLKESNDEQHIVFDDIKKT